MSLRILLAAALLTLSGCGGDSDERRDVRLLVPVGYAEDAAVERVTGCSADIRVYDDGEDLVEIAARRDVDAVAGTKAVLDRLEAAGELLPERRTDDTVDYVRLTLEGGVELTLPQSLASAYDPVETRPAGTRTTLWALRAGNGSRECARRWIADATAD
jgi:hypothetical protein